MSVKKREGSISHENSEHLGYRRYSKYLTMFAAILTINGDGIAFASSKYPMHNVPVNDVVGQNNKRPLTVADHFQFHDLDKWIIMNAPFSVDGDVAYVRIKPIISRTGFIMNRIAQLGYDNSDVWVHRKGTAAPINVTAGIRPGAGWSLPRWSPDGARLAFVSTSKQSMTLWVWEKSSGEVRQVSTAEVADQFEWIDRDRVVFGAEAEGEPSRMLWQPPSQLAVKHWGLTEAGKVSVTELKTGQRPQQASLRLRLVNVASGSDVKLADGVNPVRTVSSDLSYFATTKLRASSLADGPSLWFQSSQVSELEVFDRLGKRVIAASDGAGDVIGNSLRWSPRGHKIAFLSYGRSRTNPVNLLVLDVITKELKAMNLNGLNASPVNSGDDFGLEWSIDGKLMLKASGSDGSSRRDWWILTNNSLPSRVTSGLPEVPNVLLRARDGSGFVGKFGGANGREIWKVYTDGRLPSLIFRSKTGAINFTWPFTYMGNLVPEWSSRDYTNITFSDADRRDQNAQVPYSLNLITGKYELIRRPDRRSMVVSFFPETGDALFARMQMAVDLPMSETPEVALWRVRRAAILELMRVNKEFSNIDPGIMRKVYYKSANGGRSLAWMLLPHDYKEGKRYPTIVSVYPTGEYRGDEALVSVTGHPFGNGLIPAARGYAVLYPSIPLNKVADDLATNAMQGVMPAIDAAVASGVVDEDRLFLMGASAGADMVVRLLTRTKRFKAAVASALCTADPISDYGMFGTERRYGVDVHLDNSSEAVLTRGQTPMGGAPWEKLENYLRNMLILQTDKIDTPLMLVQGEFDHCDLSQPEELFTALQSHGKTATFLRYWAEGHTIASPANVADYWDRVFGWFGKSEKAGVETPILKAQ